MSVWRDHPLARLVRSGVRVSITVAGPVDPATELAMAVARCGLSWGEARDVLVNTANSLCLGSSPVGVEEFRLRLDALWQPVVARAGEAAAGGVSGEAGGGYDGAWDGAGGAGGGGGGGSDGGEQLEGGGASAADLVVLKPRSGSPRGGGASSDRKSVV